KDGIPVGREPDHPVVNVSWEDAQAFCQWLTIKEQTAGRLPMNMQYRLPSDHEWSCAVGIGAQEDAAKLPGEKIGKVGGVYPWGSEWPPRKNAGNYADETFHEKFPLKQNEAGNLQGNQWIEGYKDGWATTSPVDSFPANASGLHDMGGNVWEWCEDWYEQEQKNRVLRGGSWTHFDSGNRLSSSRNRGAPTIRGISNGFRVVLAPVAASEGRSAALSSATNSPTATTTPNTAPGGPSALLASATNAAPFTNTLGMRFVPVPIGGVPGKGRRVLFSVWVTRVRDYAAFAEAQKDAGKKLDESWKQQGLDGIPVGREPDHPVVSVSWDDAQAFCRWLTQKEIGQGKLVQGQRYRLPTDEEWSWAVGLPEEQGATPEEKRRNSVADIFPWGIEWPPTTKVGNYADETFHAQFPPRKNEKDGRMENGWNAGYTDGFATTSPVGSFPANMHGLHDMGGNVWQWCEDWWNANQETRVRRGSSWRYSGRADMRSSIRTNNVPTARSIDFGFRCVLDIADEAAVSSQPATATPSKARSYTNTYPAALKVAIPDWLRQASAEGGRLAFQKTVDVPALFDLGEAARFDDFVEVFCHIYAWLAVRRNGEVWGKTWGFDGKVSSFGPVQARSIVRGSTGHIVGKDGTLHRLYGGIDVELRASQWGNLSVSALTLDRATG
ncbi:MAG: SUMF1/EgtB/PvdO family nonheme iron enzyme, partial [Prosthecobacter sp.]|nr:SUMF1/EgtB/PvdO family nonheme iron enzyme [Prosthecobacter sp.]